MEFYVIRVRFMKDGTTKKSEVMTYDELRKAEAKYHSNLATDMTDETLSGGMCIVITSDGDILNGCKTKWGNKTEVEV